MKSLYISVILLIVMAFGSRMFVGCTTKMVSTDSEAHRYQIIARDGQYEKYSSSIVYDKNTGLDWVVGPDKDTNWYEAKRWIANLSLDGGGWRIPTKNEIKSLYKKRAGTRNMTSLFKNTGWFVWCGEQRSGGSVFFGPTAGFFLFNLDTYRWNVLSYSDYCRVFAVRSRRY